MNTFWDQLLDIKNLYRGWHLARADAVGNSFIEEKFYLDAFSADLHQNLSDIIHKIKEHKYTPIPLTCMEIPKNSLLSRPGSHMDIRDRVVLHTIIYLIAERVGELIHPNVYSFKIKDNYKKKKGGIFEQEDNLETPYLPKKIIDREINKFESWYYLWPEFDRKSKEAYQKNGYKFMSVSDISAYFENIQIPILRDHLLSIFQEEPLIINFLISFFESWSVKTSEGRSQWRGIPQGNEISSFLGNAFLINVDNIFKTFCEKYGAEYHRYMDDIRIFTKSEKDAKNAILELDRALKALHLNVQSGKTKILKGPEISKFLEDDRLEDIGNIIEEIKNNAPLSKVQEIRYAEKLWLLAREKVEFPHSRIIPRSKPLSNNLDMRLFLRWCSRLRMLGYPRYLPTLSFEIRNNSDSRVTKLAISAIRAFPGRKQFALELFAFLKSDMNIFPHQEATIIRSFRYLADIPSEIIDFCYKKIFDKSCEFYSKMQCLYLLERVNLTPKQYKDLLVLFRSETNPKVQIAIAGNLVKYKERNEDIIRELVFHPDNNIRNVGKYFWNLKWNEKVAERKIKYLFKTNTDISLKLCDNIAELHLLSYGAAAKKLPTNKSLISKIQKTKKKIRFADHKDILKQIIIDAENEKKAAAIKGKMLSPNIIILNSIDQVKKIAKGGW